MTKVIEKNGTSTKTAETTNLVPVKRFNEEIGKAVSVTDRLENVIQLQMLGRKYEKIKESKTKLDRFLIGSDEANQFLELKDKNGVSFVTSNANVLKQVVDVIKNAVNEQQSQLETEILKFNI
jgi:uncharacterized protein YycO